uniref:Uncharacterized protein n=1 Tax=Rhipicephalus pulchellus TaxID=72859 RepID=L7LV73_RHIPC
MASSGHLLPTSEIGKRIRLLRFLLFFPFVFHVLLCQCSAPFMLSTDRNWCSKVSLVEACVKQALPDRVVFTLLPSQPCYQRLAVMRTKGTQNSEAPCVEVTREVASSSIGLRTRKQAVIALRMTIWGALAPTW